MPNDKSALFLDVRRLKGVGGARAGHLGRLGIKRVYDLVFHIPRGYEDRRHITPIRELKEGDNAVIAGRILDVAFKRTRSRQGILEVIVSDETGALALTWFNARPSWEKNFENKIRIAAYGKVQHYQGLQIVSPDYATGESPEKSPKFGNLLPVYPLTEGVSQRLMRQLVRRALDMAAEEVLDAVPLEIAGEKGFRSKLSALWDVHIPSTPEKASQARRRLAYEELLVFQSALALQRTKVKYSRGYSFKVGHNVEKRIRCLFPFSLTEAQNRVINELRGDLRAARPMHRLLQGDVGCGKTVVAVYALLSVLAESSKQYQTAFMAPTEVLAEQHFLTLENLLAETKVRTVLLKGSIKATQRRENLRRIEEGEVDLVVGTHALIQQGVKFHRLALAVIDEQHRFGVRQRLELTRKGLRPDILMMTATPIPRTLTLTCFGDMDVSVIDRMPPGRQPVYTEWLAREQWRKAYVKALKELKAGRRVFVIFPLVEANEELDLTSATEAYDVLRSGVFKDFKCCLMHGRMPAHDKRKAMEGFRKGSFQVMVATTVVEVGIDVPEATVMIVQHAERLGLSQLHQLRGRIGRGDKPGYCYLLAGGETEDARVRLEVLGNTADGFKIAEADLRLRGPGELFGTQQSGAPELRCYDFSDLSLLQEARSDAFELIDDDPKLERKGNMMLKKAIKKRYSGRFELGGVG